MPAGFFVFILLVGWAALTLGAVPPVPAELNARYEKAAREVEAGEYAEALTDLDAIGARQPDLPRVKNLRGVILMRQGNYEKAEAAFEDALEIQPDFLSARFNLAEIPFQKQNWPEARRRFVALTKTPGLMPMARQMIDYKILLTFVHENNWDKSNELLLSLPRESAAFDFAMAAMAFQRGKSTAAQGWVGTAEKDFSPRETAPFADSLYEANWLPRPAGAPGGPVELGTAFETEARNQSDARRTLEEAEKHFQSHDFANALQLLEKLRKTGFEPALVADLRGKIFLEQKKFPEAEVALKEALSADPKFWAARFDLAEFALRRKDYHAAEEQFQGLLTDAPGGEKASAAELARYNLFLALLLDSKESEAQKLLEQFRFGGETPSLYYAQAAWAFWHHQPEQARQWIDSAQRLYSSRLNTAYAGPIADLDWQKGEEPQPESIPIALAAPSATPSPTPEAASRPPAPKVAKEKERGAAEPKPHEKKPGHRQTAWSHRKRSPSPTPTPPPVVTAPTPTPTPKRRFPSRAWQTVRHIFSHEGQLVPQSQPSPTP